MNPLRRSCVRVRRMQVKSRFLIWSATLCGDRSCRSHGMQVKLRFLISKCDPLRRSCVSSAWKAGKVAFSDFEVQPSAEIMRAEIVRVHRRNAGKVAISDFQSGRRSCTSGPTRSCCRRTDREILRTTRDPHTEILRKWSYKILTQRSCDIICARDPYTLILRK